MTRRIQLPRELADRPFHIREGAEHGLTGKLLQGPKVERPFPGIRVPRGLVVTPWQSFVPALRPGQRFSHLTAAIIRGAPVPHPLRNQVHVSSPGFTSVRVTGTWGHTHTRSTADLVNGVPVSDVPDTVIECARYLETDALVAMIDHLVLGPRFADPVRPFASLSTLRTSLRERTGRGVTRARQAADLARDGVESPPETDLRLLVVRAGLPEPIPGYEIRRGNGTAIGWFDLCWEEWHIAAEYDGDQHRTSTGQYEKDIRRFDEATAAGWIIVRVRKAGLYQRPWETLDRIRGAFATRGLIL